jgi:hypothetical protein
VEDEVLADPDTEQDFTVQHRQHHSRRTGNGSPEGRHVKHKTKQDNEMEFVNRRPDGSFILPIGDEGMTMPQMPPLQTEEELDQAEVDAHYVSIARQYFTSGAALGGRGSKKFEEGETLDLSLAANIHAN